MKLAYLCLEGTRPGQASHTHVHEIMKGLGKRGCIVDLYQPERCREQHTEPLAKKCWNYASVQARLSLRIPAYDGLYVRYHPGSLPGSLFARLARRPLILEINAPFDELPLAYPWTARALAIFRFLALRQYRLANAIVVVTEELRGWLQKFGIKQHIEVISNGADIDLFSPYAVSSQPVPKPYVIFFGALTSWQGIDLILDALSSASWPNHLNLVIAGEGPQNKAVRQAAEKCKRLFFLGRVDQSTLAGLVAGAVASLIPKSDPTGVRAGTGLAPLKLFESLACGVPVIVTDYPNQANIVRQNHCGVVLEAADSRCMVDAVSKLASSPETQAEMGSRGRSFVLKHSWDARSAQTFRLLQEIIGQQESVHSTKAKSRCRTGCGAG
jgi:glycosyltransferase involved in cell wall biosynthesis